MQTHGELFPYTYALCHGFGDIWFAHGMYNILYRVNVREGTVGSYVIPYSEKVRYGLYSDICFHDGKIWVISSKARRIVGYDCVVGRFFEIDVGNLTHQGGCRFGCSFVLGEQIYLFPYEAEGVYKITGDLRIEKVCESNDVKWVQSVDTVGEKVFFSSGETNELLVFDSLNEQIKRIRTGIENKDCDRMIRCMGEDIYILNCHPSRAALYKVDTLGNIEKMVPLPNEYMRLYKLYGEYLIIEYNCKTYFSIFDKNLIHICDIEKNYNASKFPIGEGVTLGVWCELPGNNCVYVDNVSCKMSIYDSDLSKPKDFVELNIRNKFIKEIRDSAEFELGNDTYFENNMISLPIFFEGIKVLKKNVSFHHDET